MGKIVDGLLCKKHNHFKSTSDVEKSPKRKSYVTFHHQKMLMEPEGSILCHMSIEHFIYYYGQQYGPQNPFNDVLFYLKLSPPNNTALLPVPATQIPIFRNLNNSKML